MNSKFDSFKAVPNDYYKCWKFPHSSADAKSTILTANTIQNFNNLLIAIIVGKSLSQEHYCNNNYTNNAVLSTRTFIQAFTLNHIQQKIYF
jgi:hypothetical protein